MSDHSLDVERGIVYRPGKSGRGVLYALIAFFAFILLVNAIMIWLALGSFNGLDTDEPYDRGLRYNQEIARLEAQRALGWDVSMDFAARGALAADIAVDLADGAGQPLTGASVEAELRRPASEGFDFTQPLTAIGPSRHSGQIAFPLPGQWEVRLHVSHPDGDYRLDRRVLVE